MGCTINVYDFKEYTVRAISRLRAELDSRTRLLVVIVSLAAYAVAFIALHASINEAVSPLYLLPLVVGCWAFGLRGGIGLALLSLPLNIVLLLGLGADLFLVYRLVGLGAALLVGVVIGWLFEMRDQLQEELEKRRRAEALPGRSAHRHSSPRTDGRGA